MQISFVIVTKNRVLDLTYTLQKIQTFFDENQHEVLVFIDNCKATEEIISSFDWVKWSISNIDLGASKARNTVYSHAQGKYIIGLDDDAHPLESTFLQQVVKTFEQDDSIGIIAFQEIRGLFATDIEAILAQKNNQSYFTNDFVGCGFAIRKEIYDATRGFPIWMSIYGEETAVAYEVLDLGYTIYYNNSILINHRVDVEKRKLMKRNYFRFEHQLSNVFKFILIYHRRPFFKLFKFLFHNFKKYALADSLFFRIYFKIVFQNIFLIGSTLKYRKCISKQTEVKLKTLRGLTY